jgi:hypothetical protein
MGYVLDNIPDEAERESFAQREVGIYKPLLDEHLAGSETKTESEPDDVIVDETGEHAATTEQQPGEEQAATEQQPLQPENAIEPTEEPQVTNPAPSAPEETPTAEGEQPSALSRVPKDEQGNPLLDQAEPEDAYDAAMEFLGNEKDAIEYIDSMEAQTRQDVKDATAKADKVSPRGKTLAQYRDEKAAARQKVADLQALNAKWKAIQAVRQQRKERAAAEEAERKNQEVQKAIEDKRRYDEEQAAKKEAERQAAEQAAAEEAARQQALAEQQAAEDALPENQDKREVNDQFETEFEQMVNEAANTPEVQAIMRRRQAEDNLTGPSNYRKAMEKWDAPASVEEWVLRALAANSKDEKVRWSGQDGMAAEVFGRQDAGERPDYNWLVSEKNGVSMGAFVHRLWERLRQDQGQVNFNASEVTDHDVRNALIDALRRYPKSSDLFREAAQRYRDREDETNEALSAIGQLRHDHDGIQDDWYRQRFGVSKQEHDDYIDQVYSTLREVSDEELAKAQEHINNEIADYEHSINESAAAHTDVSEGSEVLPGEQAHDVTGSEGTSSEGPTQTHGDGNSEDADAPSEQPEQSGIGASIAQASEQVNTNPTQAQIEAGNYRKGHVKIGKYDITIENPAGSIRRGVDRNGKAWENTMTHSYGYFLGTEGTDGDHIDVFLSNDIDNWDGKHMYVVDQYNEDGSFDEHKVMMGFNSAEEAKEAYLSNYEKGWEGKHKIVVTESTADDFGKWVDSSHRKTKAYAEYADVKRAQEQQQEEPNQFDRTVPATVEEQKSAIQRIVDFAKKVKNRMSRAVIGGITNRQKADFAKIGFGDIDDSWVHSIENSAVNHSQSHHGNEKVEDNRGQIAITEDDYQRIPDILENYDKVSKSTNKTKGSQNDVIIYQKEFDDGYIYYLEEKRDNRKSLAFHTMYKKKKGTDSSDGFVANATPITPVATSDNLSSDDKVTMLSSDLQVYSI